MHECQFAYLEELKNLLEMPLLEMPLLEAALDADDDNGGRHSALLFGILDHPSCL